MSADDLLGPEPDDDDLLGPAPDDETPKKPKKRDRSKSTYVRKSRAKADDGFGVQKGGVDTVVMQALQRPVSISFLADVFGRDRKTVGKRLASLPPLGYFRGNAPLYDFKQAAEYLVKPRIDPAAVIRAMNADDLPSGLQKDVWDARLKKQKWMQDAGELWATDEVLEVLGEAFQRLKTTTQLWIDRLDEEHNLPPEVRESLTASVDGLQRDLHTTLVEMPQEKSTRSQAGEIEDTDLDI